MPIKERSVIQFIDGKREGHLEISLVHVDVLTPIKLEPKQDPVARTPRVHVNAAIDFVFTGT